MKISIIIPVYGVEKYIGKCITSLLEQTNPNFNAIIVDDGSTDNSILIAKKLTSNDSRFLFIEKSNGGLSSARNYGLQFVSTDFVLFLDSDDYLQKNTIQLLIDNIETNQTADIFLFGTHFVTENGTTLNTYLPDPLKYAETDDYLLSKLSIDFSACTKLFKRKLFKNIQFIPNLAYEDKQIIVHLLYDKKLVLVPHILYNYVQRDGSIMHSYNPNCISDFTSIFQSFKDFLTKKNLSHSLTDYYKKSYILECFIPIIVHLAKFSPNYTKDCQLLDQAVDKKIVNIKNIIKTIPIRSTSFFAVMLFLISPRLFKIAFSLKDLFKKDR